MELFYSRNINGDSFTLDKDESGHCIKVLRHRSGDIINIIDGEGTLYRCRITNDNPKEAEAVIMETVRGWGTHPYRLELAVCPTKNSDRYEWFCEKACEVGLDKVSPIIGEHSERKIFKKERIGKILVSAAKQSLKAAVPEIADPETVKEFILSHSTDADKDKLRLIAYCFEDESHPRTSIKQALENFTGNDIIVMIGPEGDFSQSEAALALEKGFVPVHLGASRLRTETAAITAAEAVYIKYM